MRLGRVVKRLEARAGAVAAEQRSKGFVLSWSGDCKRVDASTLAAGEYVALDVTVLEPGFVRTVERVTRDPRDCGFVYDREGREVGRVVEVDPPYFSYCLRAECGVEVAPASNTRGDGGSGCRG